MSPAGGNPRNPPVLKRYGQHFLTDGGILDSIVDSVAPGREDTVLEIGPGRGSLTDRLAERAGRIVAIEIDRALAARLAERYAANPKIRIVQEDVLESDFAALVGADFLLVGNVPYYITTPIIFKALEPPVAARSVFLVQREVADRMASREGDASYGALTVNVAATSRVEIIRQVPAGAFTPPPRVESAVIRLTPRENPLLPRAEIPSFRAFVQAVFGQRRKQIQRVLRGVRGLTPEEVRRILGASGVEPAARPETLSPETFVELYQAVAGDGSGRKS